MLQLLAVLALIQVRLEIVDPGGFPVPGASICADSTMVAVSGLDGSVELHDPPDSIAISSIGFIPWEGLLPLEGRIVLKTVPVPSGMVITVTGTRGGLRDLYPSTTVLDADDMEHLSTFGLRALSGRSGGVFVRQYGGAMPVVSVSVRGTSAAHTGYFVDGHPIRSCMDGLPGMTLDTAVFGSMEVARGGGSGLLLGGMAGALNFRSESTGIPPRGSLSADDRGGCRLSGAVSTDAGRLALSLARVVGAGGSEALSGSFLLTGRSGPVRYGALASGSGGGTESPDWTVPTDATRQVYSVDGWLRFRSGRLGLSGDMGGRRMLYHSTAPSAADDDHREAGAGVTAEYDPPLQFLDIRLALSSRYDRLVSTSAGDRGRTSGDVSVVLGYPGIPSLSGSARLSVTDDAGPMTGAVLNAGIPLADSMLMFHMSGSSGFRRPTFNDLYWPEDEFAVGNPDLRPETSMEAEAGLSLAGGNLMSISLTGFLAVTDDLIRWEPGEGVRWSPMNVAIALRRGIEAEGWLSLGALEVSGTFTLLDVIDDDPASTNFGRTLPYTPDYTFGIQAAAELPVGIDGWVAVDGMGVRFRNYSETSWLPAYAMLSSGLEVQVPFQSGFSLGISGWNLLDEEYEETGGYPGEPRTFRATLRWSGDR